MCIKSEVEEILFKLATNDHSDDFGPNGLSALYPRVMFKLLFSLISDFNISSALR